MDDVLLKLLKNLYAKYQDDPTGFYRISEALDDNPNWRIIAQKAYNLEYIEYPGEEDYGTIARITQKGIDYINNP